MFRIIQLLLIAVLMGCSGGGNNDNGQQNGPGQIPSGFGRITFFTAIDPTITGDITLYVDDIPVGILSARFLAGGPICGSSSDRNTVTVMVGTGTHYLSAISAGGTQPGKTWTRTARDIPDGKCVLIQVNPNNLV